MQHKPTDGKSPDTRVNPKADSMRNQPEPKNYKRGAITGDRDEGGQSSNVS